MPALSLPAHFSTLPIVLKVEQRFGLTGCARLVKLLEQFAVSPMRDVGAIELAASDWREALQAGPLELNLFLTFLATDGFVTVDQPSEPNAPLRVTLTNFSDFLPPLLLPRVANDWRIWFTAEAGLSADQGKDPYNQSLFRRWCATNVTIDEINAAIELAIQEGSGTTPANLHTHLMTVRKDKLELARR
jgi:hypothetical protein